jgi:ketosteroid isomerase-like protein
MRSLTIVVLALSLVSQAGSAQADPPAPPPLPSVDLPREMDRVLRDYEREWMARSATGLAALFAEDGFVLQGGRPPVRGRAGITEAYQRAGGPLALRALAYATADTVGYIIGAYSSTPGGPDIGKFILALRRTPGGGWRIAADMDNGNSRR